MKLKPLLYPSLMLLAPLVVQADSITLVTGTPADEYLATPTTTPSPNLNDIFLNFASLSPYSTFASYTSQGVTISANDGAGDLLQVLPFSTQSNPNELYDLGPGDGSANITITNSFGTGAIGVGIADSDDTCTVSPSSCSPTTITPVNITLEALGLGGVDLGSFTVTIPETGDNPGNGYFVVEDSSPNLYGLEIVAPTTDESGLAIADVQVAPEPSSLPFLAAGVLAIMGFCRLRKKA